MHDHNGKNDNWMMWVMIPCLLLIIVVFWGGGKLISSKYLWLVMLGACVVPHIWMMLRGHGEHEDTNTEDKTETKNENNKPKHGSCCH